jgi:hypothetical protein
MDIFSGKYYSALQLELQLPDGFRVFHFSEWDVHILILRFINKNSVLINKRRLAFAKDAGI